ncbi:CBS domain-containing protein [Streptomyces collinus]|uniref:CBS domain-containing protein n=1 Tax=Streptomyces collinus TaxID=42684 RepID=UPI0033BBC3E5
MNGSPLVVSDVMTHRVVALRTGAGFKDIARTMREWGVSALPVLDDAGRVVGVVSEADLLPNVHKEDAVTAGELMSAPAVTVAPGVALARAARIMARGRVKRLPVVDREGRLKGIVSRSDLLKVFLRDDADIAGEVRREVVARLFGTDAEPLGVEVRDGVVTLTGRTHLTALIPLATHLTRTVPGVVAVRCELTGAPRPLDLDADLPDAHGPALA